MTLFDFLCEDFQVRTHKNRHYFIYRVYHKNNIEFINSGTSDYLLNNLTNDILLCTLKSSGKKDIEISFKSFPFFYILLNE